jgi:hypothetical protein
MGCDPAHKAGTRSGPMHPVRAGFFLIFSNSNKMKIGATHPVHAAASAYFLMTW